MPTLLPDPVLQEERHRLDHPGCLLFGIRKAGHRPSVEDGLPLRVGHGLKSCGTVADCRCRFAGLIELCQWPISLTLLGNIGYALTSAANFIFVSSTARSITGPCLTRYR